MAKQKTIDKYRGLLEEAFRGFEEALSDLLRLGISREKRWPLDDRHRPAVLAGSSERVAFASLILAENQGGIDHDLKALEAKVGWLVAEVGKLRGSEEAAEAEAEAAAMSGPWADADPDDLPLVRMNQRSGVEGEQELRTPAEALAYVRRCRAFDRIREGLAELREEGIEEADLLESDLVSPRIPGGEAVYAFLETRLEELRAELAGPEPEAEAA